MKYYISEKWMKDFYIQYVSFSEMTQQAKKQVMAKYNCELFIKQIWYLLD